MRALILTTHSAHVEQWWRSFESLGHSCGVIQYDKVPLREHHFIVETARLQSAEIIIYIGGVKSHNFQPLEVETLKHLRNIAPTIHLVADSTQPDWLPFLDEYHRQKCFAVQVGIDGNINSPLARYGLVLLTPLSPDSCNPKPWNDRAINCSFVGNTVNDGSVKAKLLYEMQSRGLARLYNFQIKPYENMMKVMCDSKVTFSVAHKGQYADGRALFQVCGRVIEAGIAGSCLLEQYGSPTDYWFEAGRDFYCYGTPDDAEHTLSDSSFFNERMAERFRTKVIAEHSNAVFWSKVLWKAGVR